MLGSCLLRTPVDDVWLSDTAIFGVAPSSPSAPSSPTAAAVAADPSAGYHCYRYAGERAFGGTPLECEVALRRLHAFSRIADGLAPTSETAAASSVPICASTPTYYFDDQAEDGRIGAVWLRWVSVGLIAAALLLGVLSEVFPSIRTWAPVVAATKGDIFLRGRSSVWGVVWTVPFLILVVGIMILVGLPWVVGRAIEAQSLIPDILAVADMEGDFEVSVYGPAAAAAADAAAVSASPSLIFPSGGPTLPLVRSSYMFEMDVFGLVTSCDVCDGVVATYSFSNNASAPCTLSCAFSPDVRLCRLRAVCDAVQVFDGTAAWLQFAFTSEDASSHLIAVRAAASSHYPQQETASTAVLLPPDGKVFRGPGASVVQLRSTLGVWRSDWNSSTPRAGHIVAVEGTMPGDSVGPSLYTQTSGLQVRIELRKDDAVHVVSLTRRFGTALIAVTMIGFFSGP